MTSKRKFILRKGDVVECWSPCDDKGNHNVARITCVEDGVLEAENL